MKLFWILLLLIILFYYSSSSTPSVSLSPSLSQYQVDATPDHLQESDDQPPDVQAENIRHMDNAFKMVEEVSEQYDRDIQDLMREEIAQLVDDIRHDRLD